MTFSERIVPVTVEKKPTEKKRRVTSEELNRTWEDLYEAERMLERARLNYSKLRNLFDKQTRIAAGAVCKEFLMHANLFHD